MSALVESLFFNGIANAVELLECGIAENLHLLSKKGLLNLFESRTYPGSNEGAILGVLSFKSILKLLKKQLGVG